MIRVWTAFATIYNPDPQTLRKSHATKRQLRFTEWYGIAGNVKRSCI